MGAGGFPLYEGLRERVAGQRLEFGGPGGALLATLREPQATPSWGRISTLDILPCSRLPSLDDTIGSFGDCAGMVTRHQSRSSATGE
jgi:hypothetical protein